MESPRQSLSKDKVFCSQCKYFDDKPGDKGCLSPSNKADAPQEILIRIMIVLGSGSHSQAGYTIRIKCEI